MAKYGNWTQGQIEALINTIGEENAWALIEGDVEATFQPCARKLFNKNGRRIPPRGLVAAVCDPDRNFRLDQPELDYVSRLIRLQDVGLAAGVSADEFKGRSEAILKAVSDNEQIKNLLNVNSVYLPLIIPQMSIADLGEATEKLVEAAGVSYRRQFPNRQFTNHRKGELVGQVSIVEGSNYEQLLALLPQGPAVGIYFPCLQGFSVHAQREQTATLHAEFKFVLSGPLDTAIVWAMYPDIVGRDYHTPGLDCPAVQWQSPDYSLSFNARGGSAAFGSRACLGDAFGNYSGGLLLLG